MVRDNARHRTRVTSRRVLQEAGHGRTPGRGRTESDTTGPLHFVRALQLLPVWLVPRGTAVSIEQCTVHASERPALTRPLLSAGLAKTRTLAAFTLRKSCSPSAARQQDRSMESDCGRLTGSRVLRCMMHHTPTVLLLHAMAVAVAWALCFPHASLLSMTA